jgi:hypothetical protein
MLAIITNQTFQSPLYSVKNYITFFLTFEKSDPYPILAQINFLDKSSQMAYPLIILGAGASHDFSHPVHLGLSDHRNGVTFPITDDLVTIIDKEIEGRYTGFRTMRSLITSSILSGKRTFEQCVENWVDVDQRNSLLLYLSEYFLKKSTDASISTLPTNFMALVELIYKSKEPCLPAGRSADLLIAGGSHESLE